MDVKSRKEEKSQITRASLIRVARQLFAEQGYAETATEEIVQRAGVTRGALYHHFRDKEDLFRAVYEDVERDLAQRIAAGGLTREGGAWERLLAGCQSFLDACLEPTVQRIVMLDGPAVLGWKTWREIDARYGLGLVRHGLQVAVDAGVIEAQPLEPLAHILLAALNEAAMVIARAEDVQSARAEVGATVERLLEGLKASKHG